MVGNGRNVRSLAPENDKPDTAELDGIEKLYGKLEDRGWDSTSYCTT